MKLFTKIILAVVMSITLYSQDCKSKLIVVTDFLPVQIFLDDSLISDSNYSEIELPYGDYNLSVVKNNSLWNAKTFKNSIHLQDCEIKKVFYSDKNKIYLDSSPQDAYVFKGDSLIGHTPLFINKSVNNLMLRKPGYTDLALPNNLLAERVKFNLHFTGVTKQESFFNSTAFKILAGTVITLGAVTAYYKLKADDRFDEYKITHKQELLDQTKRYDLISGITFTALQINFGFILYKFLTE